MEPVLSIGVVGATGQVGSVMRTILAERQVPIRSIRFFASSRSAGRTLDFRGSRIVVEDVATADFSGIDVALFSIGAEAALKFAPRFVDAGAIVIDNSSAFRMDPDVPLVVPEVNGDALARTPRGIIANPNCTTMIAAPVLAALDRAAGLVRVVASTYQAVSGAGGAGVAELAAQLDHSSDEFIGLALNPYAVTFGASEVFPTTIGANVIPHAGSFVGDETTEELKFIQESRKILDRPDLRVMVTCVRVPVFTGHSVSLSVELARSLSASEAKELLGSTPGVEVARVPTPLDVTGRDPVIVGRIRADDSIEHGLACFVVGDNLRKGAALNAIQILEAVSVRG
ncbi:MAG: aspartate-semialdehyde dehydrogenase [Ferrimicrobium sp.]